jgi:tetratricopeptide (TPR) repeat protein
MKDAYAKYTAAIKLKCNDKVLNSKLHCNRAVVNLKLKNYGKVIEDCKISLTYDPTYAKAYYRLGKAYIALRKFT